MKTYINEMKKCIKLAKLAQGHTSPNPMVGCIILNKSGKIIATGIHNKYGEFHAERNALNKLEDATDCTLVVNLEPCVHQGKTPPCTDIIIEKGIKRVVYGMKDPNPLVSGKGLEKLKEAGIEVIGPVLKKECEVLNEVFIKNQTQNKTFVAIKTATTIDGKIATHNGDSKWITSSKARNEVKYIRRRQDAILTSAKTIIADNPTMEFKKKVVLDRELKTDFENAEIYKQGEIYVFYNSEQNSKILNQVQNDRILFIPTPTKNKKLNIEFVLDKLFELGIMSVLVEAGGEINASFLPYTDKIYQFIAPKLLADNSGKSCFDGSKVNKIADCTQFKIENYALYPPDILITYSR
ncbi:bifunctional diaminohydroxyphosphoribosylaminopyrimidine deaminase/5-amino-6-(5-phosphoribosylamino)uracil reductase RibD [bacterium]|nr:bifunctional diaminohydroxyphosphoribosylaminopyrimidine deaminase/5-amino-6-(5-phosphoribosylamino)uracil reductase RibD [bacterium]